jgi:hypothetical protein
LEGETRGKRICKALGRNEGMRWDQPERRAGVFGGF